MVFVDLNMNIYIGILIGLWMTVAHCSDDDTSFKSWLSDYNKLFSSPKKLGQEEVQKIVAKLNQELTGLSKASKLTLTFQIENVKALGEATRLDVDKCRLDRMPVNEIDETMAHLSSHKTNVIPLLQSFKDLHFVLCDKILGGAISSAASMFMCKLSEDRIKRLFECIQQPSDNYVALIERVKKSEPSDLAGSLMMFMEKESGNLNDMNNAEFEQALQSSLVDPCQKVSKSLGKFTKFYSDLKLKDNHLLNLVEKPILFWVASAIVCEKILKNLEVVLKYSSVILYGKVPEKSFISNVFDFIIGPS